MKRLQIHAAASVSLNNVGPVPEERIGSDVSNNYDSFLFNMDSRTRRGTALKGGISYNLKGVILGAKYDRIDPLFRTLGNYYSCVMWRNPGHGGFRYDHNDCASKRNSDANTTTWSTSRTRVRCARSCPGTFPITAARSIPAR
ncbi:MAG: hypothetical protein IPF64_10825 [Flavobacteriales bacterium]|nr:hypothetical protein [Flavobacteriales bacterium]